MSSVTTPSTAPATPSGADRRGPSGLTSRQMEAALLAQSGLDVPAIAAEMGLSQRGVRRHLQAARAQGVRTRPATANAEPAPAPPQRRDGKFTTPKPPPAKARVLLTDAHGLVRYRPRAHGPERGLGKDLEIGSVDEHGRVLIASRTALAPERHATTDYYSKDETDARALERATREARARGDAGALIVGPDGDTEWVEF